MIRLGLLYLLALLTFRYFGAGWPLHLAVAFALGVALLTLLGLALILQRPNTKGRA